jgi:FkbM family methyltransferase
MNYIKIREFYNKLEDEESRFIFDMRTRYLFTGNIEYLRKMVTETNRLFHPAIIIKSAREIMNNPVDTIIYGTGKNAKPCLEMLKSAKVNVRAFCDTRYEQLQDKGFLGLPVISPDCLNTGGCAIVISAKTYQDEIIGFLFSLLGISADRIYVLDGIHRFTNYIYKPSYFEQEFFKYSNDEVYIDAGCYDGKSIFNFINACSGKYKKIIGFEPFDYSYNETVRNVESSKLHNTEIINKAVWNRECELRFNSEVVLGGAKIEESGSTIVKATTIDNTIGDEQITFIKMDIEGAELEALEGAKNTILRCKPKLAICIYHKDNDIITIPEYLYNLAPDYKYYIRHHNYIRNAATGSFYNYCDTVLYAM